MCLHLQQANTTVLICSTLAQDGECTKRTTVSGNRKSVFFSKLKLELKYVVKAISEIESGHLGHQSRQ
ncbi:unnamed protein product [Ixodes pacificus]